MKKKNKLSATPPSSRGRPLYVFLALGAGAGAAWAAHAWFKASSASSAQAVPSIATQGAPINSTNPAPTLPANASGSASGSKNGYLAVGFDKLSAFPATVIYEIVDSNTPAFYYAPKLTSEIPQDIRALNGKEVAIKGFMLPVKQHERRVTEFILLKNQGMCCFGKAPNVNEWVQVAVEGEGFKAVLDQPVTIYGKLLVGEYRENRHALWIYRLKGEGIALPSEF
jgi:hypothetical protein